MTLYMYNGHPQTTPTARQARRDWTRRRRKARKAADRSRKEKGR